MSDILEFAEMEDHRFDEDLEGDKRALVVGTHSGQDRLEAEDNLKELEALLETYGAEVVGRSLNVLRKKVASTFIGKGKVEELVQEAHQTGANLIVFDDELLPSQQRNLEQQFGLTVFDRTEVILAVFGQRAQTREAKLQIELAKTKYQAPRLKRMWTHLSRQRGGGVNMKGEGETQIEMDRRMIKVKVARLNKEISQVQHDRKIQSHARKRANIPTFAIVGYTNAGKSTLLKHLTQAEVLVEDKLFATLDTTTRKFTLPNKQDILLTDTVGFIRKLPHLLVAAFRSTLEESVDADILIHLVDASHINYKKQIEATEEVLKQLGVLDKPRILVFNKVDNCDPDRALELKIKHPGSLAISALTGEGIVGFEEALEQALRNLRVRVTLRIPHDKYKLVNELHEKGFVTLTDYEDDYVLLQAEIPSEVYHRYEPFVHRAF